MNIVNFLSLFHCHELNLSTINKNENSFTFSIMTAVFCCVAALAITGSLHHVDKDLLGWWLCERQVKSGGLNGRPEKLPDVGKLKNLVFSHNVLLASSHCHVVESF